MSSGDAPRASKRIRVVVADDDLLVRAGIVGILKASEDIDILGEADDGREAIDLVASHRPDVLLLDIQMPRLDGIGALQEIHARRPGLPVGILTTFSDERFITSAIRHGARGFLLKSDEPQQLIGGVRALAAGGGAFSPRVARWLADRERIASHRISDAELLETLSARQIELLTHVGRGFSNAQIAKTMHLSEGTVKQYLSAVFARLGIDNRVHAAIIAYRAGLLDSKGQL